MSRWAGSAAVAALLAALVVNGCGGSASASKRKPGEDAYTCLLRLEATARAQTVIRLYRRGRLGTRQQLERWANERLPFLDAAGHVIPYTRMTSSRALRMDSFALRVTGKSSYVLLTVRDAVRQARADAKSRCT